MPQVDLEQFLLTTGYIVKQLEKNPILCRVKRKRLTREENQSYVLTVVECKCMKNGNSLKIT